MQYLLTWVLAYAIDAGVTRVIPCIRALPDRVALASFSTELGDVKIYLNVWFMNRFSEFNVFDIIEQIDSPKLRLCFEISHSRDVRRNIQSLYRVELATDHQRQRKSLCEGFLGFWDWVKLFAKGVINDATGATDCVSDQSMPAGQSRAPVVWWWNPRQILTFRGIGGLSDWP